MLPSVTSIGESSLCHTASGCPNVFMVPSEPCSCGQCKVFAARRKEQLSFKETPSTSVQEFKLVFFFIRRAFENRFTKRRLTSASNVTSDY